MENFKQINLIPLQDGLFSIKITDSCVDHGFNSNDAQATIKVVNPREIIVTMTDKVELQKEIEVKVEVIDSMGDFIPAIYHEMMNLQSLIVSDIISIRSKSGPKGNDRYSIFMLTGEKLGKTTITFKAVSNLKTRTIIASSDIAVQVFRPLQIFPSNITLIVGSIFQVTVIGGPQPEATISYSLENNDIASIDASGIIKTYQIGSTQLTARAIGLNSVLYSQFEVTLEVVSINAIKIVSPSKQLMVGSEMPLHLSAVTSKSTKILSPFSFGSAIPNLRISWTASNKEVIELRGIYSEIGLNEKINSPESSNAMFSVRAYGAQAGIVTIKVNVEVTQKVSNPLFQQLVGNLPLQHEIQIRIYTPLELLNVYQASSLKPKNLILMSPGSELALKTNRQGFAKIQYSLQSKTSKIKLEKGNILKAEDIDENFLIVLAQEEFGAQQVATYRVLVKPISYLMLKPLKSFEILSNADNVIDGVPVGSTVRFEVNYYCSNGAQFDAVLSNLKVRPSRHDLLGISSSSRYENNTISVKVLKEGLTVIKAWDVSLKDKKLQDFIYLRSAQAIFPIISNPFYLVTGDVVCFNSPLTAIGGHFGSWQVEGDTKALTIDSNSGVALAQKAGQVKVLYNLSTFYTSSYVIIVKPPKSITINLKEFSFLSQTENKANLSLIISKEHESSILTAHCDEHVLRQSLASKIPFSCEILFTSPVPSSLNALMGRELLPSDLFDCTIGYNLAKSSYELQITSQPHDLNIQPLLASFETNLTVRVATPSSWSEHLLSTSATFPFYPSFYVPESELVLSNKSPLGFITICTTPFIMSTIKALPGNEDTDTVVEIFPPEKPKSSNLLFTKSDFVLIIPVQIKQIASLWQRDTSEPLNIKVWSLLIRQTRTVIIKIKWLDEGPQCPVLPRESSQSEAQKLFSSIASIFKFLLQYYQILLTSLSTCLIMFFGYHFLTRRSDMTLTKTSFSPPITIHHPHHSSFQQKRVLTFPSPSSPSSTFNTDSSLDSAHPSSPANLSRIGRPLWSNRTS